ncbi:methionyl-tRNA formyltransferase [Patescibacteria group bacterium]|nr:methionyl-tRNA formyltransferase [Patescibacteria group bacterium]MBU1613100.1 methionyl-tRNA formyltransferase [Patescibacteria group bacterium]
MIPIVFFGTYKFASAILESIVRSGLFEIRAVITQPDRPIGRHQELQKSPVKILAEKHNLTIEQPESLKGYTLHVAPYTLNIVVEYGLIIPQGILDSSERGSINIHPSLLPKYRGPSPIQSVLINGDNETGVSIMLMDKKMDHGPILSQKKFSIDPADTYTTLADKLSTLSAEMLIETVPKFLNGEIEPEVQIDENATFCKILEKDDGLVDFERTAEEIFNQFRGMIVWPGIHAYLEGKRMKFLDIRPVDLQIAPGVIKIQDEKVSVGCRTGSIELVKIQMEGKKPMGAPEFINGYNKFNGLKFN